jgi:hypothetical protein
MSALKSSTLRTGCCVAALAAFGFSPAKAQAELLWHADQYMGDTDNPADVVRFGAGSTIVIAGNYRTTSGFAYSAAMLKVSASDGGSIGWTYWPVNPTGYYSWRDAAIGSGGEIALCGWGPSTGLIGLASPTGTLVWTPQTLPAPFSAAFGVAFDPSSGDLLATGTTSTSDVYVVRYSAQGALLASKVWQHPANGDDSGYQIAVDGHGNVFVLGLADINGTPRVFVLKLDPALNVSWERESSGSGDGSYPGKLLVDGAGDLVVACSSGLTGLSSHAFTVWKLDTAGNTVWVASGSDGAHPFGAAVCIALDPFGNVDVAGWRANPMEALVQSYSPSGALLWSRPAGSSAVNYTSLAVDPGGDVLVAGTSSSYSAGIARRFDRDGNERWSYVDSNYTLMSPVVIGIGSAPDGEALIGTVCRDTWLGMSFLHEYGLSTAVFPVCAGDGSLAPCPCSNDSAPGDRSGCLHSLGTGGHLDAIGQSLLSQDTLVLSGSSMPSTPVIYFQGDLEIAPVVFGDGLRCTGGSLHRLAVLFNVSGESQYPGPGDPPLSVAGGVGSPGLRMYQAYFRDSATFCTAATFNATNAVRVHWLP